VSFQGLENACRYVLEAVLLYSWVVDSAGSLPGSKAGHPAPRLRAPSSVHTYKEYVPRDGYGVEADTNLKSLCPSIAAPQPGNRGSQTWSPKSRHCDDRDVSFISFGGGRHRTQRPRSSASTRCYREQAIGKAAPWFILAIMLFAYAVRSMYIESCSMFVRGGVYRVVKEAWAARWRNFPFRADV